MIDERCIATSKDMDAAPFHLTPYKAMTVFGYGNVTLEFLLQNDIPIEKIKFLTERGRELYDLSKKYYGQIKGEFNKILDWSEDNSYTDVFTIFKKGNIQLLINNMHDNTAVCLILNGDIIPRMISKDLGEIWDCVQMLEEKYGKGSSGN
jgi:hypothetical protein